MRFLILLAAVALAACGSGEARVGKPVSEAELSRVAEAIIVKHYQLASGADGDSRRAVFVSINGTPAPATFLARLPKGRVTFRPGNEYKPGLGTHLTVSNFTWTDESHAKGDIGEVCGPLCGQGQAVVMVVKGGIWSVESLTPTWIS